MAKRLLMSGVTMVATSSCVEHDLVVERPTCSGVGTEVGVGVVPGVRENDAEAAMAPDKLRETLVRLGDDVVFIAAALIQLLI